MTGCLAGACGMLAFHLYPWNQLKVCLQETTFLNIAALPSSAADAMSQSYLHDGTNNLTLTLHYC